MAVQLRSGKELEGRESDESGNKKYSSPEDTAREAERVVQQQNQEEGEKKKMKEKISTPNVEVPFPQRLQRARVDEQFSKFLEIFKKVEISLPFTEVVAQMPLYAKFLKDILSKKRKFAAEGVVNLIAICSAVIQRSKPEKMKDPGSFTIPCTIGKVEFKEALVDSSASINLMPLSVVQRLSLGELTPTSVTLQMADRTMEKPEGVLEDVPVKVGQFVFPVDFIILNMEEDSQAPLFLGRPFLATGAALIDVQKGVLTLKVGNESIHFNLSKSLNQQDIDITDEQCVESINPSSSELDNDCNVPLSINKDEMNFQYIEDVGSDFLHSSSQFTETVMSLN